MPSLSIKKLKKSVAHAIKQELNSTHGRPTRAEQRRGERSRLPGIVVVTSQSGEREDEEEVLRREKVKLRRACFLALEVEDGGVPSCPSVRLCTPPPTGYESYDPAASFGEPGWMERDFLAAIGKEHKKSAAGAEESAYFAGARAGTAAPAMDWSFASNKPGAAPALMSFRSAAREEPSSFPQFSSSSFDGAKNPAAPRMLTHQRSFGPDSTQYAAAAHRAQQPPQQHGMNGASRVVPVSSPFSHSNPMFRVQSSPSLPNGTAFKQPPFAINNTMPSSTVGFYGTRDAVRPKTAQLTIFYAGSVNVFDNVSAEKAQELMFLASRGSLPTSAPVARKPEAPIFAPAKVSVPEALPAKQMLFQRPQHVSPPPAAITKPNPGIFQSATPPRSASSSNLDSPVPKSSVPLAVPPVSQAPAAQPASLAATTAAAIMPRAVPQARKASLARFLEKRKERVTTAAPYPSAKSPLESSDTYGSVSANDKSSCTDIALSSNHEESLCLGQPRNISFSQESPSTKLQM